MTTAEYSVGTDLLSIKLCERVYQFLMATAIFHTLENRLSTMRDNQHLRAYFSNTAGGWTDDRALMASDGTTLRQIARRGQPVPDLPISFHDFGDFAINEAGQVAFSAEVRSIGTSSIRDGLFFFDDRFGVIPVAREGQQFLGSIIQFLHFTSFGSERSGLSDMGQIIYSFSLSDRRHVVAIATLVPEPSSLALLCIPLALALFSRRGAAKRA